MAGATAAITCTGASMSAGSRHTESQHPSGWQPIPAMRRRRRYGIAVAVVVGITAATILVEFQALRFPEEYLGAMLVGTVEGILAGWALDTLTRRLANPSPV